MATVKWIEGAAASLNAELALIEKENPAAAVSLSHRIRRAADSLADFPLMGRRGLLPGTRELIVTGYIVQYRVVGRRVEILRVWHGRRRPPI
ncbi:MAG TPA: type II toxin-antitoxin system RelE/ParE family toxin [Vineibacter sp.]|nr:type II toxin-antitoxin system RelE/ParE family toxin [Vineibacter sp.]